MWGAGTWRVPGGGAAGWTAVTGPDAGEGELKLSGSAVEVGRDDADATASGWWSDWPPEKAVVFCLRIGQAVFVAWDTEHGWMTIHRWSPQSGYRRSGRAYP